MITPGTARSSNSVTSEFVSLDARANAIDERDIVARSIKREEISTSARPFTHSLQQQYYGDVTLQLTSSDGDKAVSPETTLAALQLTDEIFPGGADGTQGCYGLLITWTTLLFSCHTYLGVGDEAWVGSPTKGPSDSACVVEVWLEAKETSTSHVEVAGTRRFLRAGCRQLVGYVPGSDPPTPIYRIEKAAYLTCDAACLLTADRLTGLGLDHVRAVRLRARYVMSDADYTDLTVSVATPEAVLTDTVLTAHIVRNAEMP